MKIVLAIVQNSNKVSLNIDTVGQHATYGG